MDGGDDRRFIGSFSIDGIGKLREAVKEKLKEFLGDYTDDTLVEYVIVLLKNGRRKEEAKNELDVFLGDDSDSFITWLWDHLRSSLHLYSKSLSMQSDKLNDVQPAVQAAVTKNESIKMESEFEEGRYKKLSKKSHHRKWKGLVEDVKEHQILKSSLGEIEPLKDNSHRKVNRAKPQESLHEGAQRKRFRSKTCGSNEVLSISEARGSSKEGVQQALNTASRRLLQFAVRDAVATSRPSILVTKTSLKRIRSVVSSASEDPALDERLETRRPVTRVSSMSTVIKAVAEAAEDVKRLGPSRDVFDRLARSADVPDILEQPTKFVEDIPEDRYNSEMNVHSSYHNNLKEQYVSDTALFPSDTEMVPESRFKYDGYNDMEIRGRGYKDVTLSSEVLREESEGAVIFPYDASDNVDERARKMLSPVSAPDALHKVVTWESPQYQEAREDVKLDINKLKIENKDIAVKLNVPLTGANKKPRVLRNGNVKSEAGLVEDSHKKQSSTHGAYATGPPTDDSDSRTIFVSNVHFAATKDSLSRHFNKSGDVLKVIILFDPATGLPKGSAYVVFMRKEAVGNALLLDGTSFMSRLLKVVKKSAAPPEPSPTSGWPRAARLYPASGFGMIPFPRGAANVYRARPLKPGARSLQWKRDMQSTPKHTSYQAGNIFLSAAPRGLTYVRADPKTNKSSSNF